MHHKLKKNIKFEQLSTTTENSPKTFEIMIILLLADAPPAPRPAQHPRATGGATKGQGNQP